MKLIHASTIFIRDSLKEIGDLQMMLRSLRGTITFTIQPSEIAASPTCEIYVRALFDFDPMQSPDIPCKEAGLRFSTGEVKTHNFLFDNAFRFL